MRALFPVFRGGKRFDPLMMAGFMSVVRVFRLLACFVRVVCFLWLCFVRVFRFVCLVWFVCFVSSVRVLCSGCPFCLSVDRVRVFFRLAAVCPIFFSRGRLRLLRPFLRVLFSLSSFFRRPLFLFPAGWRRAAGPPAWRAACRLDAPRLDGSRIGFARHWNWMKGWLSWPSTIRTIRTVRASTRPPGSRPRPIRGRRRSRGRPGGTGARLA